MKTRILLVDYIGTVNQKGQPVGHSLKVYKETKQLLGTKYAVTMAAPKPYLEAAAEDCGFILPCATEAEKSGKNSLENIRFMLRCFKNIHVALKRSESDIVWFYNVDQFLFMYLGIFGNHGKKIGVTCFAQKYPKTYHNYFFRKVCPRLQLRVSSNPEVAVGYSNQIYIPDYLYQNDRYQKYDVKIKQPKVVCVGTMNRSKQIKELVGIWNDIDYPLEIHGCFYDQEYYQEVMRLKKEHIVVINEYVDYEEYLRILGGAKYCILPYDKNAYTNTTSGVILESIFLNVIPVTSRMILDKMQVNGIGYDNMNELKQLQWQKESYDKIIAVNRKKVELVYAEGIYQKKLEKRIDAIIGC